MVDVHAIQQSPDVLNVFLKGDLVVGRGASAADNQEAQRVFLLPSHAGPGRAAAANQKSA
jgi:hypothetical protein